MLDPRARIYAVLTAVFVACLLVADLTGGKFFHLDLFTIGGFTFVTHSVGMIAFPLTFLLTDVVNEFYGPRLARQLTYTGLLCAALSFALIVAARKAPIAVGSPLDQASFEAVFSMSNRLYIASLSAFLLGQLADIAVFTRLKALTGERLVWLRATGSTLVSQLLDSFVVTAVLFIGVADARGETPDVGQIVEIALTGYVLKFVLALLLTPAVYGLRRLLRQRFGLQPA